jgi:two-component system, chemotaxis family, chemotaxis protein CheY
MASEATQDSKPNFAKAEILRLSTITVLVVDDSEFTLRLLTSVLKGLEVGRIMTATSGHEAVNLLQLSASLAEDGRHPHVDIVVSDWHMKNGDGMDVLRWVRTNSRERLRFLPFIMMSGYAESKHVKMARDKGANEFLAKPFSVSSLAQRLLTVIDKPRPFVRTPTYFGPDRRRREISFAGTDRRKAHTGQIEVIHERD